MYGTTQTKITSFQWKTYALLYFMSLCFAFPFLWYEPFCCACQPTMLVLLVLNQIAKVSHFLSFLKYVIMENLHRIFLCAHSTTVYNSISVSAQNYITHIHLRETYTTNELRVGSGYLHKHSLLCFWCCLKFAIVAKSRKNVVSSAQSDHHFFF